MGGPDADRMAKPRTHHRYVSSSFCFLHLHTNISPSDNPWTTARSLASKAGKVLGKLLAQRVLGNRPITLVGYSLGSLVIFEALQYLASLPPAQTYHLIEDVFLFGAPVATDEAQWAAARRVVAGRLVNGYGANDYVLAILSRVSNVSWTVAGMGPVSVQGVENVDCSEVDGHLQWRRMVGHCLSECHAPGIVEYEVERQLELDTAVEIDMDEGPADEIDMDKGPAAEIDTDEDEPDIVINGPYVSQQPTREEA